MDPARTMPSKKKISTPVPDIDLRNDREAFTRGSSFTPTRVTGVEKPSIRLTYQDQIARLSAGYQFDIQGLHHTKRPNQTVTGSTNPVRQTNGEVSQGLALADLVQLDPMDLVAKDRTLPQDTRAFLTRELEDREDLQFQIEARLRADGYIRQDELYMHSLALAENGIPIRNMSRETAKQLQLTSIVLSRRYPGTALQISPIWVRPPVPVTSIRSPPMRPDMPGRPPVNAVFYDTPTAAAPQADQLLKEEDRELEQLHDLPDLGEQPRATSTSRSSAPDMEIPGSKRNRISSSPLPPWRVNSRTNPEATLEPRVRPQPTNSKYNVIPPAKDVVLQDDTRDMWPTTKQYYQHKATGTMRMMDEILAGAPIAGLQKTYSMPRDEILHRVCMLASTSLSVLEARGISREQFLDIAGRHEEGNKMDVADIMKQFYTQRLEPEDRSDESSDDFSDELSDDGS